MKAIFKGDAVRNTYTLDTGLEKLEGSDVSYFAREPKLVHHAEKVEDDVILEKDISFNKIMVICAARDVTVDGITFRYPVIVNLNLDEDTVVLEVDGTTVINDEDAEEKIETYNRLMEDYRKQHEYDSLWGEVPHAKSCEEEKCDESETKEDKEIEDIEERIFGELFGILGI